MKLEDIDRDTEEGASDRETGEGKLGQQKDDDQATAAELPVDQIFDTLKNERRRTVLRYLKLTEGSVKLGELSEHVAAIENDIDEVQVTSDQRKRVYVGLYQCHLPKMDDMNIVEFNQNRGIIELGPNASELDKYLNLGESETRNWHRLYTGIGGLGLVLTAASAVTTGAVLSPLVAIAVLQALVIITCAFHLRDR